MTIPSSPPISVPPPSANVAPPLGVKHVIAVGGGRGGVGKSVVAVNLAVYLAQLGRKVLLIDADPSGAEFRHRHDEQEQHQHDGGRGEHQPHPPWVAVDVPALGLIQLENRFFLATWRKLLSVGAKITLFHH